MNLKNIFVKKKKGNKLHAIFTKKNLIGNINIRFLTKNKCYVGFN